MRSETNISTAKTLTLKENPIVLKNTEKSNQPSDTLSNLNISHLTSPKTDSVLPSKYTLICSVKDIQKKTLIDTKPVIIEQTTKTEASVTKTSDGEWTCAVEKGKTYKIKCTVFGYKNAEQSITINHVLSTMSIGLEPLKQGDNFVMKSIYFYPNTYALKKSSLPELQELLQYLSNNENVSVEIQGHSNGDHRITKNKAYSTLSEEWNFEGSAKNLSQKRAEAIKKYLESNGVKAGRLEAKGYGGKKPIVKDPQTNEEGQLNIRVELVILKS
jgi:outer membrane protein OmpA-like peptidoglycan-associated protein